MVQSTNLVTTLEGVIQHGRLETPQVMSMMFPASEPPAIYGMSNDLSKILLDIYST